MIGRLLRAVARLILSLTLLAAVLFALHWLFADRLPPALQHPVVAWRLVRSEPPVRLPVPVAGVSASQLRDTWNAPRSGGRLHQGIDIFAPRGREVISSTAGIVITVGENELGGRVVRVLGPNVRFVGLAGGPIVTVTVFEPVEPAALTAVVANSPVASAPNVPPTQCTPTTSRASSYPKRPFIITAP